MNLGLLPQAGNDLILAGALLSIVLNPFLFAFVDRFSDRLRKREEEEEAAGAPPLPSQPQFRSTNLTGHAVLVGYGRVGRLIERALQERGIPLLVIDERAATLETLRSMGVEVFVGQANEPELLKAVNLAGARWLVSAIPNPFEASNLIEAGRKANPRLTIIARAHSEAEVEHLKRYGADRIVLGEQEIALEMTRLILQRTDADAVDGDAFSQAQEADTGGSTGSGSDTPDPPR